MPQSRNTSKPNSRAFRSAAAKTIVLLPAAGCDLPVPPVPAECRALWDKNQKARWRELWHSPQATQWDESCRGTVAALVTYETAILSGTASAWQAQESRYASEALGLTPRAMLALGWEIQE